MPVLTHGLNGPWPEPADHISDAQATGLPGTYRTSTGPSASITDSAYVGGPDGDLRLHPDLDRLTELTAQPGWAWAPADRYDQEGLPHPCCQRQFARRMTDQAHAAGFDVRMGFETEWVVLRGTEDGVDGEPTYATAGPAYPAL